MWAFKTLWDKGLIYEGFQVLAYCWRCETPLSNTETRMDDVYRDRQDPALTVSSSSSTPASASWRGRRRRGRCRRNLALAVGPDIDYAVMEEDGVRYILAESRLPARTTAELRERRPRRHDQGQRPRRSALHATVPVLRRHDRTRFQVLGGDFVSTEDGTGIVHMAPGFGEDDQNACNAAGIPTVCPMDEHGRFTAEVPPWAGHARLRRQQRHRQGS